MADFQEYQAMKRHSQIQDQGTHRDNQQPNPGTTLAPSNTSAIDPSLEIASRLDEVQKELASLKRRRDQEEEDDDDEEDDRRGRRRGRKGRSRNEQILTRYDAKLSGKERQVYKELKAKTRLQVQELTGIGKNPFARKTTTLLSDEEGADSEPSTPTPGPGQMRVAFGRPVDEPENRKIIERAAHLIHAQETNQETWTITHKDVKFTKRDLEEFAKDTIRNWQQAYNHKKNEDKRTKRKMHVDRNRRVQRQRALKLRRSDPEVIAMYTKKHPGTNLEPILKTPFMTEENSEFSATDEEVRKQLLTKAREDVGMTEKEITEGIKVLEVRSLAWRSRKLRHIYEELDAYHNKKMRLNTKKTAPALRRVNLNRPREGPPTIAVCPFMISSNWHYANPDVELTTKKKNPHGLREEYSTDEGEYHEAASDPEINAGPISREPDSEQDA
ncbi:hypothetical protein PHLCEN_2v6600 [Hermanssonia centrifuga]|uniref:Uncharacterized protein n=1 Tax=Hermanssonia centrifuga TaxID=98765 RepID=A0A2R6NZ08_9APHY|nr:hypothetical protein PHLCEN_2v6600 [Hermanssonia centrifuga]